MPKTKCELCKCLNLVSEGRKHPSQTIWHALTRKFESIRKKEPSAIESFCGNHRHPMTLVSDIQSVAEFIRRCSLPWTITRS